MKTKVSVSMSLVLALAACAAPTPADRAEQAANSMASFRAEISEGQKQVDTTTAAANALNTATDKKAAYDHLVAETANVESKAADLRATADAMKAKGREFFKKWEEQIAQIKDDGLRAKAKERSAERSKQYADLEMKMSSVKGAYTPYLQDLKDLQVAVGNDLNPKGIESASGALKKTNLDATELKNKLGDVSKALEPIENDLKGGAPAPAMK